MSNPINASSILATRARRLGYASPWEIPEIAESVRVALADQERDERRLAAEAQQDGETIEQAMERLATEAEAARAAEDAPAPPAEPASDADFPASNPAGTPAE